MKIRELFSLENIVSLLVGGGLASLLCLFASRSAREAIAGDYLAITGALLGVVFAGMALVVALMNDAYMRLLDETPNGLPGFLSPFMIALGIQVLTVLLSVGYRAFAGLLVPSGIEPWLFGLVTILFVSSCLEVVVLARTVFMHARLRVKMSKVVQIEQQRGRKDAAS
jgi:hypothetical protein